MFTPTLRMYLPYFFLSAPAELQINVPELVDRRTYQYTLIPSSFGDEKAKALARFHVLTGCDTVEKFTSKSKEPWTKHFLQADSKILNAFCKYPQTHFSDDFQAINRFAVKSYVPKSSKITDLAEAH